MNYRVIFFLIWIIISILMLTTDKSNADPDIMELNTPYDYGFIVGNMQCLSLDPEMNEPNSYYTADVFDREEDKAEFAKGRIDGCMKAIEEERILQNKELWQ